jgi:RND family efflux transporter MFP subunit
MKREATTMSREQVLRSVRTALGWLLGAGVLVVVLLALAGVFEERIGPGDGAPDAAPPATGPSAAAERVREAVVERFPGTVRAVHRAIVSARILAAVKDVLVRSGDRVSEGDTLLALDARELVAREQQVREALAADAARLRQAEAEYDRMKALLADGSVSQSVFDGAEAAFRAATADVEAGRRRVDEAQVALTWADIRAPFAAVVSERFVDPGDQAAPGVALLKLYDPAHMRLEAHVRESLAVGLERGDTVRVALDALDIEVEGAVEEIVPQAETGSRSLLVKVSLPATGRLYPGMFGRLLLPAGTRHRILVPAVAVHRVGQLAYVELAAPASGRRMVVVGPAASGDRTEILSGLAPGERVLLPPGE